MFDARSAEFPKPDWVLLGMPLPVSDDAPPEVCVVASTKLTRGELVATLDNIGRHLPPPRYHLTVDLDQFTIATGATYAEAIAKIMGTWSPDDMRTSGALPEGQRELPSQTIAYLPSGRKSLLGKLAQRQCTCEGSSAWSPPCPVHSDPVDR